VENSPIVQASNQGLKGFLINLIACLYPDVVKSVIKIWPSGKPFFPNLASLGQIFHGKSFA
jgi:hypothetical protein